MPMRHQPFSCLDLDRTLDSVVEAPFRIDTPKILYHYTGWSGVKGILESRQFRATAHDCTNDEAELISANSVILQVAKELRARTHGTPKIVLSRFVQTYAQQQIAKAGRVFLSCFSIARDDPEQWRKYGAAGQGLCLGIRVLNEPPPLESDRGSAIIRVDYSEASWRTDLRKHFEQVCAVLQPCRVTEGNIGLGLLALRRIAAFRAMSAKREGWAAEREYRRVTLLHKESTAVPIECRSDEKVKRYLMTDVRADSQRIALAEVLVGPNQQFEEAAARLALMLRAAGYVPGGEYPDVMKSGILVDRAASHATE